MSSAPAAARALALRLQVFLLLCQVPTIALPVWWGAFAAARGYTLVDYGVLVTAGMVGPSLASLVIAAAIERLDRRLVIAGAMLVCAATFAGYALVTDPFAIAVLWGITMAAQSAGAYFFAQSYFGALPDMDRQLGIHITVSMLLQAALLAAIPPLSAGIGLGGVQVALGLGALAAAAVALTLPGGPAASAATEDQAPRVRWFAPPVLLAIATFTAFYSYITEFYNYSERFGNALGLSATAVGAVLGATTLVGVLGSLLATVLGNRAGRVLPLTLGALLGLTAALLVTVESLGAHGYWIAMSLFSIVWSLMQPYATALLLAVDPTGRALMLSVPARGLLGAGISAAVTAASVRYGLVAVVWASVGLIALAPPLAWFATRAAREPRAAVLPASG